MKEYTIFTDLDLDFNISDIEILKVNDKLDFNHSNKYQKPTSIRALKRKQKRKAKKVSKKLKNK